MRTMLCAGMAFTSLLVGCGVAESSVEPPNELPDGGLGCGGRLSGTQGVVFDPMLPGTTATFAVPVQSTFGQAETLLSANFVGSGAAQFAVLSNFPMNVPAAGTVDVEIVFAPQAVGQFSAELDFQSSDDDIPSVPVQGAGTLNLSDAG